MRFGAHIRLLVTGLMLTFAVALAVPAGAQQVNPTADAVRERQFLDALKGNPQAELQGRISIPDQKAATLERPAGRDWRAFHQGTMLRTAVIAVLGTLLVLAAFFLIRGRIRTDAQGRYSFRSIKPEYFVGVGICSHLGCSPSDRFQPGAQPSLPDDWAGGFLCPCHGSTFDLAGRVFKNKPAPDNLEVPPHMYLSDSKLLIGEDKKA